MGKVAVVVIGRAGVGKTYLCRQLVPQFPGVSKASDEEVTTTVQSCGYDGFVVYDVPGDDYGVRNFPDIDDRACSDVVVLVLVSHRYMKEFRQYVQARPSYAHAMVCVREHHTAKVGPENQSVGVADVTLALCRSRAKPIPKQPSQKLTPAKVKRPKKVQGPNQGPNLLSVVVPSLPGEMSKRLSLKGVIKQEKGQGQAALYINDLKAYGDALLLLAVRVHNLNERFKDNQQLVRFIQTKPEWHNAICEAYDNGVGETKLGDGVEALFAFAAFGEKGKLKNGARRLFRQYIEFAMCSS